MADQPMCYIGIRRCGCVVAAIVDEPEHARDTAKEISRWISGGLTVERATVEEVRVRLTFDCPHRDQEVQVANSDQPRLFE